MVGIERAMDPSPASGKDPLDVRKANLYGATAGEPRPTARPWRTMPGPEMIEQLEAGSDYRARRAAIAPSTPRARWLKRGIALTPVKFGISFTATHLNQAGALVHVYTDGS
jgi:xanthine dehydrogenase large subunit